jgi:DNA-binding protein H-NS
MRQSAARCNHPEYFLRIRRAASLLLHNHQSPLPIRRGNPVATYQELKAQAEKLFAEAEEMRQKEIDGAIADIREKIQLYGLTAADLGLAAGGPGASRRGKPQAVAAVKYRGPNGETWGGGRGRKPQWVTKALKEGRDLSEFAVGSGGRDRGSA